jgi:hypothetical protein
MLVEQFVTTKTIYLRTIRNDSTTVDLDLGVSSDLGRSITQSGRVHGSAFAVLGGSVFVSRFNRWNLSEALHATREQSQHAA